MTACRKASLIVLAILAVIGWGRGFSLAADPKADYKLTIYDDEHLKGRNLIVRQAVADLKTLKFDNKSESIEWHAPRGKAFVVFSEKKFEKPVLVLVGKGDVQDLGKEQRNALHSISSVSLVP